MLQLRATTGSKEINTFCTVDVMTVWIVRDTLLTLFSLVEPQTKNAKDIKERAAKYELKWLLTLHSFKEPSYKNILIAMEELSHFVKVTIYWYFVNKSKSKQNSFLKDWIKCMSMRLFLTSTSFFPKFLLSKLIALQKTAKWNWLLLWNDSNNFY